MSTVQIRAESLPLSGASASWGGVIAIALGAFALVVTEFLPVGMVTQISQGLGVTEGQAGLAITATSLIAFLVAPLTAIGIGHVDRRHVLLSCTVLLIVSGLMSVFASSFAFLLASRLLLGAGVGAFWAISLNAAANLVPPEKVNMASSAVLGGISVGAVISVPAAAYLASHVSWQSAFGASLVLSVFALLAQLVFVPSLPTREAVSRKHFGQLLRAPDALLILGTVLLVVSGQYAGYTFIAPYLERVAGVQAGLLPLLLLGYGVLTVVGNFVGGAIAGRSVKAAVYATLILYVAAYVWMGLFGTRIGATIGSLAAWSVAWGMAPVATQLWLFRATRYAPEAAQGLNTSVFQLAITAGSLIAAQTLRVLDLPSTIWVGAVIIGLALLAATAGFMREPRPPQATLS